MGSPPIRPRRRLPATSSASRAPVANAKCRSLEAQLRGKTTRNRSMKRQDARDAKNLEEPSEELDRDVSEVLAAAIEVHRILGPGFLESVYEHALCVELGLRNVQ